MKFYITEGHLEYLEQKFFISKDGTLKSKDKRENSRLATNANARMLLNFFSSNTKEITENAFEYFRSITGFPELSTIYATDLGKIEYEVLCYGEASVGAGSTNDYLTRTDADKCILYHNKNAVKIIIIFYAIPL